MGKRGRRRTRATGAALPETSQHMARVNIEDECWKAFRVEAIRANTSVAAYLGSLVRREVRRAEGRRRAIDATDDSSEWQSRQGSRPVPEAAIEGHERAPQYRPRQRR